MEAELSVYEQYMELTKNGCGTLLSEWIKDKNNAELVIEEIPAASTNEFSQVMHKKQILTLISFGVMLVQFCTINLILFEVSSYSVTDFAKSWSFTSIMIKIFIILYLPAQITANFSDNLKKELYSGSVHLTSEYYVPFLVIYNLVISVPLSFFKALFSGRVLLFARFFSIGFEIIIYYFNIIATAFVVRAQEDATNTLVYLTALLITLDLDRTLARLIKVKTTQVTIVDLDTYNRKKQQAEYDIRYDTAQLSLYVIFVVIVFICTYSAYV